PHFLLNVPGLFVPGNLAVEPVDLLLDLNSGIKLLHLKVGHLDLGRRRRGTPAAGRTQDAEDADDDEQNDDAGAAKALAGTAFRSGVGAGRLWSGAALADVANAVTELLLVIIPGSAGIIGSHDGANSSNKVGGCLLSGYHAGRGQATGRGEPSRWAST